MIGVKVATALAELISITHYDWLIFKPHHVWRLRPWGQVCFFSRPLFFLFFWRHFFVFVHAHECQRFPTLANVFVSVLAEETMVQCSWMHKQSLFPFLSHIPPSPPLFLTSKPILSPLSSQYLTCTPHAEQWRSHLLCAILSPSLFSSPLFGYLSYLTPFLHHLSLLHWFVDSCGARAQKHPIHHPALHPP